MKEANIELARRIYQRGVENSAAEISWRTEQGQLSTLRKLANGAFQVAEVFEAEEKKYEEPKLHS